MTHTASPQDDSVPDPISVARMKKHFREIYQLSESQVETMIMSSSKSIQLCLSDLVGAAQAAESKNERLKAVFHGLKGLLLNMGEQGWALYVSQLEQKLLTGEQIDHQLAVNNLCRGVEEVLDYCRASSVIGKQELYSERKKGGGCG